MLKKDKFQIRHSNLLKKIVIGLIVFSVILIQFLNGLDYKKFHPDEALWIKYSSYFKLFWIDKDFHNNQWEAWGCKDQPPVGKYMIGLSLFLYGKEKVLQEVDKIPPWDWGRDEKWNEMHGVMPSREMLFIARLTMAIFGAIVCLLVYIIGVIVFGTNTGIIAALLLAYSPLMLLCSKRAMTDAPVMFFMTANILLMIGFYYAVLRHRKISVLFMAFLIGINNALAVGTKYNGGLSGIIFTLFCIIISVVKIKEISSQRVSGTNLISQIIIDKQLKLIFICWLISILVQISIFVGINPFFYHQTFKRLVAQLSFRAELVYYLQTENPSVALRSLSQKIIFVITRTPFPGRSVFLGNILKIPVDHAIFLMGLVLLIYTELKYFLKTKKISYKSIILIWVFVTFVGTIAWIPLGWVRYYLPVVPCIAMMMGYSLDMITWRVWLFLKRRITFLLPIRRI